MLKVKTCLVTVISASLYNLFTSITTPVNSLQKRYKIKVFLSFPLDQLGNSGCKLRY